MTIISIVIPCFNHGEFLMEALDSVKILKEQGVAEVIIVNDGSTEPRTKEILHDLERRGWDIIHQENMGLAKARNVGIHKANSNYILPLDSDNLISASFLMEAIDVLTKDPSTEIVYSDSVRFGEVDAYHKVGEFDPCRLINDNFIDACAVYRKELWSELGGYDEKMPVMGNEDWDFWIAALMKSKKFHYIPTAGFKYRVRHNSMLRMITIPNIEITREYIYSKYCLPLFESIRKNYVDQEENYKIRYMNLLTDMQDHRVKNIVKLLIGREIL